MTADYLDYFWRFSILSSRGASNLNRKHGDRPMRSRKRGTESDRCPSPARHIRRPWRSAFPRFLRPSPYPDHRSHGLAGKHIRSGGKQIGGEPLARGCRQTNQSNGQSPRPLYTDTIGITQTAQTSIAIFLPAFTENPARISRDESYPPATLPASEIA